VGKSLFLVGLKVDAIIHVNAIIQDLKHGEYLELRSSPRNITYCLKENCRLHIFLGVQTTRIEFY